MERLDQNKKRNLFLTILVIAILAAILIYCQGIKITKVVTDPATGKQVTKIYTYVDTHLDAYKIRILNLCAVYTVLGLSMNLVNGFTGLFSLGQAGFMAIGAYVTALLTLPPASKVSNFFMEPIVGWLANVNLPFPFALIVAGLITAAFAWLIGAPVLRLRGDYLAIATLGFAEIIRVVIVNLQNITNGALGLKNIPATTNLYWSFGAAILTILLMRSFINSSYGRSIKAIREDEIAAENMGIHLYKVKNLSFVLSAFLAGVGGGLLGNLLGTIDPNMFKITLTYNILLIIVLGGIGSVTGTVISAFIITISQEALRFLDEPIGFGGHTVELVGLRMVVFSALLMICILFFRNGIMGKKEFTWNGLWKRLGSGGRPKKQKPLSGGGGEL